MAQRTLEEPLASVEIPAEALASAQENARAVDQGDAFAREIFPALGRAELLGLGAPANAGGELLKQAAVIEALAERSLASGFALWGHRMCIEYLAAADTDWARSILPDLQAGTVPGVSGMASAFKTFAGAGTLDLSMVREGGSVVLSGTLPWASNLYADALVVSAAWDRTEGADQAVPTVVAFWLSTEGVEVGKDLDLLALQGTASTYVKVQDARIPAQQVLSTDFYDFLGRCRPTFGILQSAFCMGLATASFRMARANLPGLNEVFFDEFSDLQDQLEDARCTLRDYARCVGTPEAPERRDVLRLRLRAGQLAVALAALEGKTSGGKGYVVTSDANRRLRESLFLPVQSPSEAQLKWEIAKGS
ncbi:acyl-CoA dehydrogenase family protein [Nesterenkonia sp. NBAIMH1]|uniref:acyl-CoA dehydrogenase family protein n=1 Tax=Nesterenkonia sp. NBAIMH1 TaxID=2600320 RepID=UPI00143D4BB2|nr:acyl-CoA dehydrogenase family protein [Nesterenkonia sp. NBAIMH1]